MDGERRYRPYTESILGQLAAIRQAQVAGYLTWRQAKEATDALMARLAAENQMQRAMAERAAPITPYEYQSGITGLNKIVRGESVDPFEAQSTFRTFSPDQVRVLMQQSMRDQQLQGQAAMKAQQQQQAAWARDPLVVALAAQQKQLAEAAKPGSGAEWVMGPDRKRAFPKITPNYAAFEAALQTSRLPEIVALRKALGIQEGQVPTPEQLKRLSEFAPEYAWQTGKGREFIQSVPGQGAPANAPVSSPEFPERRPDKTSSAEDVLGPLAMREFPTARSGGGLQFPGGWERLPEGLPAYAGLPKPAPDAWLAWEARPYAPLQMYAQTSRGHNIPVLSNELEPGARQITGVDQAKDVLSPVSDARERMLAFFLPGMWFEDYGRG